MCSGAIRALSSRARAANSLCTPFPNRVFARPQRFERCVESSPALGCMIITPINSPNVEKSNRQVAVLVNPALQSPKPQPPWEAVDASAQHVAAVRKMCVAASRPSPGSLPPSLTAKLSS